jgi:multidrug efflux system membrane fusion protein
MARARWFTLLSVCVSIGLGSLPGCEHRTAEAQQPPHVEVSYPLEKVVNDYVDFTGRTAATDSMDVRARVTGYLWKMPFKEGDFVKKDEVLFEIDPRPYQADLDKAVAQVKLTEAQLKLAQADYGRAKEVAKTPGAISQQEVDTFAAKVDVAAAQRDAAKANVESTKLNVDFCKVTSLIDGRVSRYLKTTGNLINKDETLLTTIVTMDPMYAYFDVDEYTMLKIQKMIREGKIKTYSKGKIKVLLGLANEGNRFPHEGYVDFVNNQVDPTTGTIQVRGEFANPQTNKAYLLVPNEFVRIRMLVGDPHPAVLINERAMASDQGQKYVLVVDDKNTVRYQKIVPGQVQEGLIEVSQGLTAKDKVIVRGLQKVHSGIHVNAKLVPMPLPTEIDPGTSPLQPLTTPSAPVNGGGRPAAATKSTDAPSR